MSIKRFDELYCWQKSSKSCELIYDSYERCSIYSLKDQMLRASLSVMNNIAEGFERDTNKEFVRFLYYAKGSCAEVRSMLVYSRNIQFLSEEKYKEYMKMTHDVSALIYKLIQSLRL